MSDNDLILRGDALDCFMGLDRIGDIMDAIAAIPAAPAPTLAAALAMPEIASLVDALDNLLSAADAYAETPPQSCIEALASCDVATAAEAARAALAAIEVTP